MFTLEKFISKNEVVTSSTLLGRCRADGYNPAHARQLVFRASTHTGFWRSSKLVLPKNERLFAHKSFMGTDEFNSQLISILAKNRPGLYRLSMRLLSDETVLKQVAKFLLAVPEAKGLTRFSNYESEVAALEEVMLGRREGSGTVSERITRPQFAARSTGLIAWLKARSRLHIESYIARVLMEHFRRQNIISWNSPFSYDELGCTIFKNYPFTDAGFSWLSPVIQWSQSSRPKPAPVLLHVSAQECQTWDVEGFLTRIERAGANKTSRIKILGIIAAPSFSREAWKIVKDKQLWGINLKQLFGEDAFKAFTVIEDLLKNTIGDAKKANDEEYLELSDLVESLKTNPFIVDLKSLAFEAVTGFLIKNQGWEEVQLNLSVPYKLQEGVTQREIDVSGQKSSWDEVFIVECKAEKATKELDAQYVKKFFTESVIAFLDFKCKPQRPRICRAEIWTTGVISETAVQALREIKLPKYIEPALRSGEDIVKDLPPTLKSVGRLIRTISQV